MAEYITYITIGNKPESLRNYLVETYGIAAEQAKDILDSDPYQPKSREDQHQWVKRVMTKVRALNV